MERNTQFFNEIAFCIAVTKSRSAWSKGVKLYAYEFIDTLEDLHNNGYINICQVTDRLALKKILLNGADSWRQYSWSGSALIYDEDIALRLSTPSELKRTHIGEKQPNSSEQWLDVQARALHQAYALVLNAFMEIVSRETIKER